MSKARRAAKIVRRIAHDSRFRTCVASRATHGRNGYLVWIAVNEAWSVVDRMLHIGRREGDASGIGEVIAE